MSWSLRQSRGGSDGDWVLSENISRNGKFKIIQLGNIGLGSFVDKPMKTISESAFFDIQGTPIHKGDLLINRMVDSHLYCCILENDGDFITSVDVCWIRECKSFLNYFLMLLIEKPANQRKLLTLSSGSGRVRISKKNLFNQFQLSLPAIPEQQKIASFLKDGTPGHDQSGILFSRLDMEAFQRCFIAWVASLHETPEGVVAIDGKTLRRSFDTRSPEAPIHMISAWPCDHQLVPGQRKIDDRSNEITAIPELLALLALKGAIVTIDAIGCQRKICQQIMDQEAGYVIGLKGNQGSLREDVELFFDEHPERDTGAKFIEKSEAADAGHGRIETRCCTVCSNTEPNATNGRA